MNNGIFQSKVANVYSQNGDDGIIEAILEYFGIDGGVCCEFGASDGLSLSNTANLWKEKSEKWKGLLIEPSPMCRDALIRNTKDYSNVKISFDAINIHNINQIIQSNLPEGDFRFLSIDIDGDDLGVFSSLSLTPSIVMIESTHAFGDIDHATSDSGSTAKAVVRIAKNKGYVPVATTGNIFLVHQSMKQIRDIPEIDNCWIDLDMVDRLQRLPRKYN